MFQQKMQRYKQQKLKLLKINNAFSFLSKIHQSNANILTPHQTICDLKIWAFTKPQAAAIQFSRNTIMKMILSNKISMVKRLCIRVYL